MKTAVRVFHDSPDGRVSDITHVVEAPSTIDAVCMALDRIEAAGIDLTTCRNVSLVAKAFPAGQHLMTAEYLVGKPAEVTPCAA